MLNGTDRGLGHGEGHHGRARVSPAQALCHAGGDREDVRGRVADLAADDVVVR